MMFLLCLSFFITLSDQGRVRRARGDGAVLRLGKQHMLHLLDGLLLLDVGVAEPLQHLLLKNLELSRLAVLLLELALLALQLLVLCMPVLLELVDEELLLLDLGGLL